RRADRRLRRRAGAAALPVVVDAIARGAAVRAGRGPDAGAALGGRSGWTVADEGSEPGAVAAYAGLVLGGVGTRVVEADGVAIRQRERRAAGAHGARRALGTRQAGAPPPVDVAAAQAGVVAVETLELRVAADGALRRMRIRTGAATPLRAGDVPVAAHRPGPGAGGLRAPRAARAAPRPAHAAAARVRVSAVHALDR